jgi:hypothetical protein
MYTKLLNDLRRRFWVVGELFGEEVEIRRLLLALPVPFGICSSAFLTCR